MRKSGYVTACALTALLVIGGCGRGTKSTETADLAVQEEAGSAEAAPEEGPAPQVFDADFGTLEYRGVQDATGNAVISFMLTNKTNTAISAYAENVVINGQFSVQTLGGASNVAPGTSGAFSLTFGVPTQTTLESVSEISSISGDARVSPRDSATETIGYIHFDVTV